MSSYSNANGKLLLANLNEYTLQNVVSNMHFTPYTPYTITSADALLEELQTLRGKDIVEQSGENYLNQADIK